MSALSPSPVRLCATLWTVAQQAPLTTEFSKQEYQTGLPFLPPGDLPNPGIEPASPKSLALTGRFFTIAPHEKPIIWHLVVVFSHPVTL